MHICIILLSIVHSMHLHIFFIDVLHVKYEMDYVCKHICKLTSGIEIESMPSRGEYVYIYLKKPSVN